MFTAKTEDNLDTMFDDDGKLSVLIDSPENPKKMKPNSKTTVNINILRVNLYVYKI